MIIRKADPEDQGGLSSGGEIVRFQMKPDQQHIQHQDPEDQGGLSSGGVDRQDPGLGGGSSHFI